MTTGAATHIRLARPRRGRANEQRGDMQPAKADIDRHRDIWGGFILFTKLSIAAIAVVMVLMWFLVA